MTVATRSKRSQKAKAVKTGSTPAATNGAEPTPRFDPSRIEVAIEKLTNELNPRQHFDRDKIEALAATIRTQGLLQPLVVRPHPKKVAEGFYQVIAGGRRLTACKLAGYTPVPCECYPLSDSEALEIALVENLQREDLNAIEEALAFEQATRPAEKRGLGLTQTALAERLGVTQGHIANRIRLLKLSKKWRERVISGEMTAGHARELVPYAHPELMKILEKPDRWNKDPWKETVADFRDWIRRRIEQETRSLSEPFESWETGYQKITIKPTDEERARLCIVTITGDDGKGEEVCTNVKLFDELVKRAVEERKKKAAAREAKNEAKAEKRSPAEQKKAEAQKREQYRRRLEDFRVDWLRYLIAGTFAEPKQIPAGGRMTPTRVLLWMGVEDGGYQSHTPRKEVFAAALGLKDDYRSGESWWKAIAKLDDKQVPSIALDLVRRMFFDEKDGACGGLPDYVVEGVAEELEIDLAAAWQREKCGALTARYFSLHTKEQLLELAEELGDGLADNLAKSAMVDLLVRSGVGQQKLPRELAGKKGK
jgi:ParB/RepB/Spo0J family partition protein